MRWSPEIVGRGGILFYTDRVARIACSLKVTLPSPPALVGRELLRSSVTGEPHATHFCAAQREAAVGEAPWRLRRHDGDDFGWGTAVELEVPDEDVAWSGRQEPVAVWAELDIPHQS